MSERGEDTNKKQLDDAPATKKARLSRPSPSNIQSLEDFTIHYGNPFSVQYKHQNVLIPLERKDCDIKKCVHDYLKFIGAKELFRVTTLLSSPSTVAEVEPFVFATNSPLLLFTHFTIQKNAPNEAPSHDTVVNACKAAISDAERGSEISKGEEEKETEHPTLPRNIDQDDPEELAQVYFAVEYFLRRSARGRGRCGFVIGERSHPEAVHEPLVAVEVRTNRVDVYTGVYQCFASLLLLREDRKNRNLPAVPLWGIVTDYSIWQLIRLEGNAIAKSKAIHIFLEDLVYGPGVVILFNFLFQILRIDPASCDFSERAERVDRKTQQFVDEALAGLNVK